jgi:uncharacterized membrane protein
MSDAPTTLALAAGLGAVAGMRSVAPAALLSRRLARHPRHARGAARLLAHAPVARALTLAAAGEMAADKTALLPDRIAPLPLAGRAFLGAFSGAVVAGRCGGAAPAATLAAALVGALAATGSTFLVYHLRREAGTRSGLPDLVFALAEDAVVLAAGTRLASAVA